MVGRLLYWAHRSQVLWYDAVTIEGELQHQNMLNSFNQRFFDACDGIFLNYFWQPADIVRSRANGKDRRFDVFAGIDVFGRGTYGGGGMSCSKACKVAPLRHF